MTDNKVLWSDLDIELADRISKLELEPTWKFFVQSIATNFLYSIRKAVEDGSKNKKKE